jgi:hypothetical protein
MSSATRRLLAATAVPLLSLFVVAFGWSGVASAHFVSGIDVNCDDVTLNFAQFPSEGVTVHIAATVEGQGALATDVLVQGDMSAQLNISSATSALAGASANLDVDATWNFEGPQHVHEAFSVTCGSSTSTTVNQCGCGSTTTTVVGVTSTTAETTGTTVGTGGTTTPTATEGHPTGPTSTTQVSVLGSETSSPPGTPNGGTAGGAAASETAGTGPISPTGATNANNGSGTLPLTGGPPLPLLSIGLASVGAGLAALIRSRARRGMMHY